MKLKSRFHGSMEGISLGDHILASTPDSTRHGIYTGNCRVISVKTGIVIYESLEEFSLGNPLQVWLQKSDFDAAEIVSRAESQIGVFIEPWNDHLFCEWCLLGLKLAPET